MSEPYAIKEHRLFYIVNAKDETIAHVKTYARHGVRWQRQIDTPYDRLSDQEQKSDQIEADKVLFTMGQGPIQ